MAAELAARYRTVEERVAVLEQHPHEPETFDIGSSVGEEWDKASSLGDFEFVDPQTFATNVSFSGISIDQAAITTMPDMNDATSTRSDSLEQAQLGAAMAASVKEHRINTTSDSRSANDTTKGGTIHEHRNPEPGSEPTTFITRVDPTCSGAAGSSRDGAVPPPPPPFLPKETHTDAALRRERAKSAADYVNLVEQMIKTHKAVIKSTPAHEERMVQKVGKSCINYD